MSFVAGHLLGHLLSKQELGRYPSLSIRLGHKIFQGEQNYLVEGTALQSLNHGDREQTKKENSAKKLQS
jgi:hypothetical protein